MSHFVALQKKKSLFVVCHFVQAPECDFTAVITLCNAWDEIYQLFYCRQHIFD